jgi:hypothetical protein
MLDTKTEFKRQVSVLLDLNYPKHLGISTEDFIKLLEPLESKLNGLNFSNIDFEEGYLPFCIVINSNDLNLEDMMSLVQYNDKPGVSIMRPRTANDFKTIDSVHIPENIAYILLDIDRGKEFLNVIPSEALKTISSRNRSPLTIAEGISIITQFPDFLKKNNCFSLLASRFQGDQRVPAIWINGNKEANLGWCWDNNPHTWLGSASCSKRLS